MSDFDYDRSDLPRRYNEARALAPAVMDLWLDAISRRVPRAEVRTVVDLGCGTGRFSAALGERYAARVIGIDPSQKMLQAPAPAGDKGPCYVRAGGEHVPLRNGCADLVFMSMVWHHLRDKDKAGREIARVLRPGGYFCIRLSTTDVLETSVYRRFFPTARQIQEKKLPSRAELNRRLAVCGLSFHAHCVIRHPIGDTPRAYAGRIALRGYSDLEMISDQEFERGMIELRRYCEGQPQDQAITEDIDLFVFERGR